jgi:hypothetical protein
MVLTSDLPEASPGLLRTRSLASVEAYDQEVHRTECSDSMYYS